MGENTTNEYFYKPSLGASGATELALFDAKLDATDLVIKANVDARITTPIAINKGGTASITASAARTALGLAIGTNVLAQQTIGIANDNLVEIDHASVADNDYAKFTTAGLEGKSYSEVRIDLGLIIGTNVAASGANTDITSLSGLTTPLGADYGGTGIANNIASTITITGSYALTITITEATGITLPASGTLMANLLEDTTPELGGEMDCGAHTIGFTQQTVTYDVTTTTVDWTLGNKAIMTFGAGNIGTFAFTNPSNPCNLVLKIIQDVTGSRTITAWDADIKWADGTAPTLTTTANGIDIVSFYWDGTNYFGVASLAFA